MNAFTGVLAVWGEALLIGVALTLPAVAYRWLRDRRDRRITQLCDLSTPLPGEQVNQ